MSEVLFMASVLLLLIGAMGFYFYTRILYTEKKVSLLETILLDIKMMLEMEDFHQPSNSLKYDGASKNAVTQEKVQILEPENLESGDTEELKDETEYYNSVIESVAAESVLPDSNQVSETSVSEATNAVASDDYDSQTRDQLAALAEKRGLKITKRTQRQTIVNLLRESDKNTSGTVELGKDGSSAGPFSSMDEKGAPLDMGSVEEVRL